MKPRNGSNQASENHGGERATRERVAVGRAAVNPVSQKHPSPEERGGEPAVRRSALEAADSAGPGKGEDQADSRAENEDT